MAQLNVGLVGGAEGFFGQVHLQSVNLDPQRRVLASVLSRDPEKSLLWGERWCIPHPFGTLDEMIKAHQSGGVPLDYAVAAVPNSEHVKVAVPLIEAGIPVLCEKPLADTIENAITIARAARKIGTCMLACRATN